MLGEETFCAELILFGVVWTLASCASWITAGTTKGIDWCEIDTGFLLLPPDDMNDADSGDQTVYVSRTRDGSLWLRLGRDPVTLDWSFENETRLTLQTYLLDQSSLSLLDSIPYQGHCVLTDLQLTLTAEAGWHPSYMSVFYPRSKEHKVVLFRHRQDCLANTTVTLTPDKQRLFCTGPPEEEERTVCGLRNLPSFHRGSEEVFLKFLNFDPVGPEHWQCANETKARNAYTLTGSYYHAYIKVASCNPPTDSRLFGHEARLRLHRDLTQNLVLITDPIQTALHDGLIIGWRLFVKVVSVQHDVFLQLWRPNPFTSDVYTLVGQTHHHPRELRLQKIDLEPRHWLRLRKGDVLGLYFPRFSPLAWSSVPCAFDEQIHRFRANPGDVILGKTMTFEVAPSGHDACRQYSYTAVLANRSNQRVVEDWFCPTRTFTDFPFDGDSSRSFESGPPDHRKVSEDEKDNDDDDDDDERKEENDDHVEQKRHDSYDDDDDAEMTGCIVVVFSCLLVSLLAVGILSYVRAVKS